MTKGTSGLSCFQFSNVFLKILAAPDKIISALTQYWH